MNLNTIFSQTLFLFGAGSTQEAGCKPSKEMLNDLNRVLETEENIHDRELQLEAYRFIRSTLDFQNSWRNIKLRNEDYGANIEEFVLILRKVINRDLYIASPLVGNWNEKILYLESQKKSIFEDLLTLIENQCLPKWLEFDKKRRNKLLKPIKRFFQDTQSDNYLLDIFTLNYDLVFDSYFSEEDENIINDGFVRNEWSNNFDNTNTFRINYYKLHGSLNWEKEEASDDVIRLNKSIVADNPHLIFGQQEKIASVEPFLSLISQFRECLDRKQYYFIIGYSFFDKYINNMILEALNKNVERKLIVTVNPKKIKNLNGKTIADKISFAKNIIAQQILRIQGNDEYGKNFQAKKISAEKIEIIPMRASVFYRDFFSNKGSKFSEMLTRFTSQDSPFEYDSAVF